MSGKLFITFVQFEMNGSHCTSVSLVAPTQLNEIYRGLFSCFASLPTDPVVSSQVHHRSSAVFAATPGGWKRPCYDTCLRLNGNQRLTNHQFSLWNEKSATSGFRNTEPFDIKEQETMCPLLSPPPAVSCVPAAGLFTSQRRVFPGVANQGKPWRCRVPVPPDISCETA